MSIAKTVGTGTAWSTAGNILGKIFIFLNVFIILRHLSVYEYGLVELVLSVVSTLSIVLLPGLSQTIVADLSVERGRKEFGRMKAIFLQFSLLTIALSVIAWAVLFFAADVAAQFAGNPSIGYLLKIASFILLVTPLRAISMMLASIELRYLDQSFYAIVEEIAKLVCLSICFFTLHLGLDGLLYAIVLSQAVTVIFFAPRSLSAYRIFGRVPAENPYYLWKIIQEHRKWSIVTSYIGSSAQTLQVWTIKLFLGTEAVGLFSFANGIVSQVASFLPLANVMAPLLPRYVDKKHDFARYVRSASKAHVLLSLGLIVCTYIGLPILIAIFPKYAPAAWLIVIMIWSIIPASISNIYTVAFAALKDQYGFFWSSVVKIILIVPCMAVGVWSLGVIGIGLGVFLQITISMLERSYRLKRTLPEFSLSRGDLFTVDAYEKALFSEAIIKWRRRIGV